MKKDFNEIKIIYIVLGLTVILTALFLSYSLYRISINDNDDK